MLKHLPNIFSQKPLEIKHTNLEELANSLGKFIASNNETLKAMFNTILSKQYQEIVGVYIVLYLLVEKVRNVYGIDIDLVALEKDSLGLLEKHWTKIGDKLFETFDSDIMKQINDIFKDKQPGS